MERNNLCLLFHTDCIIIVMCQILLMGGEFVLTDIILPITTTFISFIAIFFAIFTWRAELQASRNIQRYNIITQAEDMLAENKACLRFYGINPDTIEELYGVTSAELAYLLKAFNSGSISNLLSNDKCKKPFEKGSYWYDILKNEHTQKAFPLVKLLFDSNNQYIARCEKTIHSIKQMDTNNVHDKVT